MRRTSLRQTSHADYDSVVKIGSQGQEEAFMVMRSHVGETVGE